MLTVGGTLVAPESTSRNGLSTDAWRPEAQAGIAARADAIRSEGAVAACQIVHLGRETLLADTWFHPVGPSPVRSPREPTRPRPMADAEIDAVVERFVAGAVNGHVAGFQVVELHAAHGYLLAQFLSPFANRRPEADTVEGRVVVFARIIEGIRTAISDAVLGVRLSTEGEQEAGFGLDDLCELLPHVSPLVDYVNVTAGVRTTYVKDMGTRTRQCCRASSVSARSSTSRFLRSQQERQSPRPAPARRGRWLWLVVLRQRCRTRRGRGIRQDHRRHARIRIRRGPPGGGPRAADRPLERHPGPVRTFTALESLDEGAARLRNVLASTTEEVSADTVIVVGERRARHWGGLVPAGAQVQVIGDAIVPRRVARRRGGPCRGGGRHARPRDRAIAAVER